MLRLSQAPKWESIDGTFYDSDQVRVVNYHAYSGYTDALPYMHINWSPVTGENEIHHFGGNWARSDAKQLLKDFNTYEKTQDGEPFFNRLVRWIDGTL